MPSDRANRGMTLAELSESTGISASTLSRLESGQRRPTLELLLLRLILGDQDLTLTAGEVPEFDAHIPHWFGNSSAEPVEILGLFGPQGEHAHVRTQPNTH